jgi:hypothetical protein
MKDVLLTGLLHTESLFQCLDTMSRLPKWPVVFLDRGWREAKRCVLRVLLCQREQERKGYER